MAELMGSWLTSTILLLLLVAELIYRIYWTKSHKESTDRLLQVKDERIKAKDDQINQLRAKSIWEDTEAILKMKDEELRSTREQLDAATEELRSRGPRPAEDERQGS